MARGGAEDDGQAMATAPLLGQRIADTDTAIALLRPQFAGLADEEARLLLLDGALRLKAVRVVPGTGRQVELALRTILRDALLAEAEAMILAHNHPGGEATPSAADRSATRRLADAARPLGIRLIDHLVFAPAGVASFRELGLL